MGYYVNPPSESKESFLARCGTEIGEDVKWEDIPAGHLPVIHVNNGPFTAAAIGYSQREYESFLDPGDRRPRKVYQVLVTDLVPVSGDDFAAHAKREGLVEAA